MKIKAGDVVAIKTTGEQVFVLGVHDDAKDKKVYPEAGQLSGVYATVRRPAEGGGGIYHNTEEFFIEELETIEERRVRIRKEFNMMAGESALEGTPIDYSSSAVN